MISVAGGQKFNNLDNLIQIFEEPLIFVTLFFPIFIGFNDLNIFRIWHNSCSYTFKDIDAERRQDRQSIF